MGNEREFVEKKNDESNGEWEGICRKKNDESNGEWEGICRKKTMKPRFYNFFSPYNTLTWSRNSKYIIIVIIKVTPKFTHNCFIHYNCYD
jgi:hypothetical protein